jgi:HNH endonuclease
MITMIPLYGKGGIVGHAMIDAADEELVRPFRWNIHRGYAKCHPPHAPGERQRDMMMHRLILGLSPGEKGDHINGDKLDNRRSNLRRCTHAENMRNMKAHRGRGLPRGVYATKSGKFKSQIMANGEHIYLGTYPSADMARDVRVAAEIKYHGEFAAVLGAQP